MIKFWPHALNFFEFEARAVVPSPRGGLDPLQSCIWAEPALQ